MKVVPLDCQQQNNLAFAEQPDIEHRHNTYLHDSLGLHPEAKYATKSSFVRLDVVADEGEA